jgi:hypothetical protein
MYFMGYTGATQDRGLNITVTKKVFVKGGMCRLIRLKG